jgi:hypothetical protein
MKKIGAGHAANKNNPIGKGTVGAGQDKAKKLPPWLKKKSPKAR